MSSKHHPLHRAHEWICGILQRWLDLRCDLAGLDLGDADILSDLAAGRD